MSLAKAVEFVFSGGVDMKSGRLITYRTEEKLDTFDSFCRAVKGQIAFMGNIDNKDVDFQGWTPEDVKRVARQVLDIRRSVTGLLQPAAAETQQ